MEFKDVSKGEMKTKEKIVLTRRCFWYSHATAISNDMLITIHQQFTVAIVHQIKLFEFDFVDDH